MAVITRAQNSLVVDEAFQALQLTGAATEGFLNGDVRDVALLSDGKFICVGSFNSFNGTQVGGIVRLNADGTLDTSFDAGVGFGQNAKATVVLPLSDGKYFIGGFVGMNNFRGNAIPNGYCIINADGTFNNSMVQQPLINGLSNTLDYIYDAVEVSNGNILIAGLFSYFSNATSYNFAILNRANGSVAKSTLSTVLHTNLENVFNAKAMSLHYVDDNNIYAGGLFGYTINGKQIRNVIKFNTDFVIDEDYMYDTASATYKSPNAIVNKVILNSNNELFIAGNFTQVGGANHSKITKLGSNGLVETSFSNPSITSTYNVQGFALDATNNVYAIATDPSVTTTPFNATMYKISATGTILNSEAFTTNSNYFRVIPSGNDMLLFGGYTKYGTTYTNRITKLNSTLQVITTFNGHSGIGAGSISAIVRDANNNIYVSGSFSGYGTTPTKGILKFDANGNFVSSFNPPMHGAITSMIVLGSSQRLFVAEGNKLHILNSATGATAATHSIASTGTGDILSMAAYNDKLYLGGTFTNFNGKAYLMRVNWTESGITNDIYFQNLSLNGPVYVIKSLNLEGVFVGGYFSTVTEAGIATPHNYGSILKFKTNGDLDSWYKNAGFRLVNNGVATIYDINVEGGYANVLVAGNFNMFRGRVTQSYVADVNGLARINGSDDTNVGASSFPNKLAVGEVATKISRINNETFLVALNSANGYANNSKTKRMAIIASTGLPNNNLLNAIPSDLLNNNITAISTFDETTKSIYIAGNFTDVFGVNRNKMARLFLAVPAPVVSSPQKFCAVGLPTLANIQYSGATAVAFYESTSATTALPLTTPLLNGATYYVSNIAADGESIARTAVTVNLTTTFEREDVINECGSFTWINGQEYTTSTVFPYPTYVYGQSVEGCDSVAILNLTINPVSNVTNFTATVCGSVYTHPSNGFTYTSTSTDYISTITARDTLSTVHGCDSIITYNLTFVLPVTAQENEVACESFTWPLNNTEYTESGTYFHTLESSYGCDSIIQLNLEILTPETVNSSVTTCGTFTFNGTLYDQEGQYSLSHTFQNVHGCDSVVTINLTIVDQIAVTQTFSECGSFVWSKNGQTYEESGSYTFLKEATNQDDCDTLFTLNLTINAIPSASVLTDVYTLTASEENATYQWINCATNLAIPGATSRTFTVTENGSYKVEVTKNSCQAVSNCLEFTDLSVGNVKNTAIQVYPNPTSGNVTIEVGNAIQGATIEVINALGQIVQSLHVDSLNVYQLNITGETGLYLIKVISEEEIFSTRITVQNQ